MAPSTTLTRLFLAPTAAVAALIGFAAAPAQAAVWTSSEQWGNYTTDDGYILYNNIWGSGAGTQTIWADSSSSWGVTADHPDTGGIKSYPNAKKIVDKPLSSLSSLTSDYNVTVPSAGCVQHVVRHLGHGLRLRGHALGQLQRGGRTARHPQGTVSLGGHTWDVYKGDNGANEVFSFLRTSDSSSGTVDILPILKWINTEGWWGDETIGDVQFGYEITSASGGLDFVTNGFDVTSS